MSKSVLVLGIPHQLQGPGFLGYVEDRSYALLVENLMQDDVDFVFEEAAGRGPSIAELLVDAFPRAVKYVDIDPPPDKRPMYGIAMKVGGGGPIDPCNSPDMYESSKVDEQSKREELWLHCILCKPFKKGLAIVGLAHSLSFAIRLLSAGVSVDETYSYIPFNKLCTRSH
jgi:hypothetical protein